ncbi:MAG TPA: A/G-specific adenine glycosylase [Egibacteraceae bacterium]|nr:A/G-specific adenine glycosylase [Egibacteraceae bacterium]
MPHSPPRARALRFQRLLLDWYAAQARALPWRRTRDPYRVLVSEIMLQQTQVSRVEPLYRAFLRRFPSARALAAAPAAEVLGAWRGLGYNRRALNLHRAAQAVVQRHGGRVPGDLEALRALPGVGDYTARAVLAFAFGRDAAPVDTNVARVLARAVAGAPLGKAQAQRLADAVLPRGRAAEWGNALMDLGARVCTARLPRCEDCPVASACAWRRAGGADPAAAGALRPRPQAPFAGSDRFHRGRLVDALRDGPLLPGALGRAAQLDDAARLEGIVAALVREGMAQWAGGVLRLPRAEAAPRA